MLRAGRGPRGGALRWALPWLCPWSALGAALKLPQLRALGRRAGPQPPSLLLELPGLLACLRGQCYCGDPLLTYLEYPVLIAQAVTVLLCVLHLNGSVRRAAPYFAGFLSSGFVLTLQRWVIDLAVNLCTFISAASEFAQLQDLWKRGTRER